MLRQKYESWLMVDRSIASINKLLLSGQQAKPSLCREIIFEIFQRM